MGPLRWCLITLLVTSCTTTKPVPVPEPVQVPEPITLPAPKLFGIQILPSEEGSLCALVLRLLFDDGSADLVRLPPQICVLTEV